jgi:hypothetical protein
MLPDFDELGYLPPGVHAATLDEVATRFGSESELRRVQFESPSWLMEAVRHAGIERVIINGSFVTSKREPNDVDIALQIGDNVESTLPELRALLTGMPFLEVQMLRRGDFEFLVEDIYCSDRDGQPKGVVEIEQ